ncbi:casein kinase I [Drosophila eugracilis]|uniref:casein kinase I n=1 Tax=Drosophila eugracilis TaxID=29029 RepID=UPI001BDB4A8C|nr:casein kinase I [Drosophila eugracilis]
MDLSANMNDYVIGPKMGFGSFGEIYKAQHKKSGARVAMKVERSDIITPQLLFEYKLYNNLRHGLGIPQVYEFLKASRYNVMVMELLGPSLGDLFTVCQNRLSVKTVVMLAEQMVERLEYVHSHNILHRDIKPENFLMGRGVNKDRLYLIDFGLAKKYWDEVENKHVQHKTGGRMTGTARYASINAMQGGVQSRRDDLESLSYVLMYLLRGSLPWQGIFASTKQQKHEIIAEKKLSTPPEILCCGYPEEFYHFVSYSRTLSFEEEPCYKKIQRAFIALLYRLNYDNDRIYDWDVQKENIMKRANKEDSEVDIG